MVRKLRFALLLLCLGLVFQANAQRNVFWLGTSSNWDDISNWSESVLLQTDTLIFENGISNNVSLPTGGTFAGIIVRNNTLVQFSAISVSTMNFGKLKLEAGSEMQISSSNKIKVYVGQVAHIFGRISFISGADHSLESDVMNGIQFHAGSRFTADSGYTGFPFGTAAASEQSVVFEDGATYAHNGGKSPFGDGLVAAITTFSQLSKYLIISNNPDIRFSGYNLGDIINNSANPVTVTSNSMSNKIFSFNKFINKTSEFVYAGTEFDQIKVTGDSIIADGGKIKFTTGKTGINFMHDTSFLVGPNSIEFEFVSNAENSFVGVGAEKKLALRTNLFLTSTNQPITMIVNGILGCWTHQITLSNSKLSFTNSSVLISAHPAGIAGSISGGAIQYNFGMNLVFNGTVAQNTGLSVMPGAQYGGMSILNPSGVTLDRNLIITDSLNLYQGKLYIENFDIQIGADNKGSAISYIVTDGSGVAKCNIAASDYNTFHIGTDVSYSPVAITAYAADLFTVNVFPDLLTNGTSGGAISDNTVVNQSWNISKTSGTTQFSLVLYWENTLQGALFNPNDAYISTYTAGAWTTGTGTSIQTFDASYNYLDDGLTYTNSGVYGVKSTANTTPTSADNTITGSENTDYTFDEIDFPYSDAESDPFYQIQVVDIPLTGSLYLDSNSNGTIDAGELIAPNQLILISDINAGKLKFKPAANGFGTPYTTFSFSVSDGVGFSLPVNIMTINVLHPNNPPTSTDKYLTTPFETDFIFSVTDIPFSDTDAGDVLSVLRINTLPLDGILYMDNNTSGNHTPGEDVVASQEINIADITSSKFRFMPDIGFSGTVSFNFEVSDGMDFSSGNYIMNINVSGTANAAPTASDNTVTTNYGEDYVFAESEFGYSDAELDPFSELKITSLPAFGTVYLDSNTSGEYEAGEELATGIGISATTIQNGKLAYEPAAGYSGMFAFVFEVSDGTSYSSASYQMTINVLANVPPSSQDVNLNTNYQTLYTFSTSDFAYFDTETWQTLSAISFENMASNGLLFLDYNLSGTYSGAGEDIIALQSISISDISAGYLCYMPNVGFSGIDNLFFYVSDGTDFSTTANIAFMNVGVAANTPPTSADFWKTTNFETELVFAETDFPFTDTDAGATFTSVIFNTLPANGAVFMDLDDSGGYSGATEDIAVSQALSVSDIALGRLHYLPNIAFSGDDYIHFDVSDGTDYSAGNYIITITVSTPANTPPTSADGTVNTPFGTNYVFVETDFGFSDTDAGDIFTLLKINTFPSSGTLFLDTNFDGIYDAGTEDITLGIDIDANQISLGALAFEPNLGFSGTSTFSFSVSDGTDYSTGNYIITIKVLPATNTPPTVADVSVTCLYETDYIFLITDFSSGYFDAESNPMDSVYVETLPTNGTLILNGTALNAGDGVSQADYTNLIFVYSPATAFSGTDVFQFSATDGASRSNIATMTITVEAAANTPPASANIGVSTNFETELVFAETDFPFTDTDAGATFTSVIFNTLPANGAVFMDLDDSGGYSGATEDIAVSQALSVSDIALGRLHYLPNIAFSGDDYIHFDVSDGTDYSAGNYIITITVSTPANTPPTSADNSVTMIYEYDFVFQTSDFPFADADAGDVLNSIKIKSLTSLGKLYLDANVSGSFDTGEEVALNQDILVSDISTGKFCYMHNYLTWGVDVFDFQVSDGTDYSITSNSLTININAPVNTPPTSADKTVTTAFETDYTFISTDFAYFDADNDALMEIVIESAPAIGILYKDLNANNIAEVSEIVISGNSVSPTELSSGVLKFQPEAGASGSPYSYFTFKVSDGTDFSPIKTITINVLAPINGQPSSADFSISTNFETEYVFSVSEFQFFDTDAADELTLLKITTLPTNGILYLDSDNSGTYNGTSENVILMQEIPSSDLAASRLRYSPNTDFSGSDLLRFGVSDGKEYGMFNYQVSINVGSPPINTPPTSANFTVNTIFETDYAFNQNEFTFSDFDTSDKLNSIKINSLPTNGKLYLDSDNSETISSGEEVTALQVIDTVPISKLRYSPNTGFSGTDFAFFEVSDGTNFSSENYQITIQVAAPTNTPPTAEYQEFTINSDILSGTVIGNLAASDTEGNEIEFAVLEGDTDIFEITPSGQISVLDASLLVEATEFLFKIKITDNGTPIGSSLFELKIIVQKAENQLIFTNYFSPNDDGKNDTWQIGGDLSQLRTFSVQIFDTNGKIVCESTGYDNSWDGTRSGQALPAGVYYYLIKNNATEYRGAITLGR